MSGTWILLLLTFCYSDKNIISCYQCFIKIILRKSTDNTCAWEQRKLGDLAVFNPKKDLPDEFEYVDLESVVGAEMLEFYTGKGQR